MRVLLVLLIIYFITQVFGHSCDYYTCYNACYGLGQACVETCYSNCLNRN